MYFSADYNEVRDANNSLPVGGVYKGNQMLNYYITGTFDYLTTYYWRIDERDGPNIFTGEVLQFTTRPAVFDPNLLVWYKFDETSGNIAEDSSGHEYDGEVQGPEDGWDVNDAFDGASRIFDNDTGITVPGDITNHIYDQITVAVWVKTDVPVGDDMTVLDIGPPRHDSL
ncbi:MAG TPA: hypothetical protein VMX13_08765 [Sedimentisphaerales bacterium]|nr:hypothetical protein [Sedimentisphaerales bacterium]